MVLLWDSVFIFHSVYISEFSLCFLSLSLGVSLGPSLSLFSSLLGELLPKLVSRFGEQLKIPWGGGGQHAQLSLAGQGFGCDWRD